MYSNLPLKKLSVLHLTCRVLCTLIACALLRNWDALEVQDDLGSEPCILASIVTSTEGMDSRTV